MWTASKDTFSITLLAVRSRYLHSPIRILHGDLLTTGLVPRRDVIQRHSRLDLHRGREIPYAQGQRKARRNAYRPHGRRRHGVIKVVSEWIAPASEDRNLISQKYVCVNDEVDE